MTLEQFWTILLKQWKFILLCFVVVGLGTYVGTKLMTPLYQSTVLIQVVVPSGSNSADYNSLLASDQLVQTEAQLAVSDPVLRTVASHYSGLTAAELLKEVTSAAKPNTQLFEINVLDPNPARAAALANDVAATLIQQQDQVAQQDNSQSQQQIQQDLKQTQAQIDAITNQIAALQAKPAANGPPAANGAKIASLQARLNGLQQHYSQWETLLAQLELTQAQDGNILRVVQPAQASLAPARPNVLLNTASGLAAGLFLGLLLALLFEQLDTRVRAPETLSQLLGWPLLATVWRTASPTEELVNPVGHTANVESYRILRTNIGFSVLDKPLRTIMVTSADPREGKSMIAANLAIFMAKAGKNTLLIDADLRRPTLHQKFHLSIDKMGLSDAVVAFSQLLFASQASTQLLTPPACKLSLDAYMHTVNFPNLRVMPSGPLPPNPPDLLDSKAMQQLFAALTDCGAEVVIFDTPPVLGLSDTSILASKVDGTVFVVDITRSNKKNLAQAKGLLTQAGAHVLGCVVNKQRHSRKDKAYSYYYRAEEADQSMRNGNKPAVPSIPVQPPPR